MACLYLVMRENWVTYKDQNGAKICIERSCGPILTRVLVAIGSNPTLPWLQSFYGIPRLAGTVLERILLIMACSSILTLIVPYISVLLACIILYIPFSRFRLDDRSPLSLTAQEKMCWRKFNAYALGAHQNAVCIDHSIGLCWCRLAMTLRKRHNYNRIRTCPFRLRLSHILHFKCHNMGTPAIFDSCFSCLPLGTRNLQVPNTEPPRQ